jgi:hypothetical protein
MVSDAQRRPKLQDCVPSWPALAGTSHAFQIYFTRTDQIRQTISRRIGAPPLILTACKISFLWCVEAD